MTELWNGWTPRPAAPPELPFRVSRTAKGGRLPVYSEIRHFGSQRFTDVRKVQGDVVSLQRELSIVCGGALVERKLGNHLRITGSHVPTVRRHLARLGF